VIDNQPAYPGAKRDGASVFFTPLAVMEILLSTSVAITLLFAVKPAGLWRRTHSDTTSHSLEEEVQASFHAYRSLWQSRLSRWRR